MKAQESAEKNPKSVQSSKVLGHFAKTDVRYGDRGSSSEAIAVHKRGYVSQNLGEASDASTTAVPLGGQLSSGCAVRFPVKTSRLLFITIFDVFYL